MNRRRFLQKSVLAAALGAPGALSSLAQPRGAGAPARPGAAAQVALTDTNIHLFEWPFRHLKYGRTPALVEKLRRHGVQRAWAGTFEGLFSKDLGGANARLAEECRREGAGMLVPFGSVNPAWPDWEEELRRCHEVHRMSGIRLHPPYQGYTLESPEFARLLAKATERRLLVQIVLEMEDPRVHHPAVISPSATPAPLVPLLEQLPSARVQLLGDTFVWLRQPNAKALMGAKNLAHDISSIEGVGGVLRLAEGKHWNLPGQVPLERLLFGSHAPYYPIENALLKMFEAPLTLPEMQAVMETNARRLLTVA